SIVNRPLLTIFSNIIKLLLSSDKKSLIRF
uniref:Uncharacterized protein n=1 Tax=Amphimedon queenslandica TaxID=400682 RepID=A0A1X7VEF4_AMPQE